MKPGGKKKSDHSSIQRKTADSPFLSRKGSESFFASRVQTKLAVGEDNNSFEKEADSLADQVIQKEETDLSPIQPKSQSFANQITPLPQRKASQPDQEEDKMTVQAKGESTEHSDNSKTEQQLHESKGSGSQLAEPVKSEMEQSFGSDFSDVRVHTDSRAHEMNKNLNAKAFTHGKDIYFGSSNYSPRTREGQHLLAHELTHTVQQSGSVQPKMIQRTNGEGTGASGGSTISTINRPNEFNSITGKGKIERQGGAAYKFTIPTVKMPLEKRSYIPQPLEFPLRRRPGTTQRETWDRVMLEAPNLDQKIETKLQQRNSPPLVDVQPGRQPRHAFKLRRNENVLVIGTIASLKRRMIRPFWTPSGQTKTYDVDHQREMQIGGEDFIDNMWLWDSSANRSSGNAINIEKNHRINQLITEATGPEPEKLFTSSNKPDLDSLIDSGGSSVKFNRVTYNLPYSGGKRTYYTRDDIQTDLKPLDGLIPLSVAERESIGFGREDQLLLFTNSTGGRHFKIDNWDRANPSRGLSLNLGQNAASNSISFVEGQGGTLDVTLFQSTPYLESGRKQVPIRPFDGIPMAGYIPNGRNLISSLTGMGMTLFSPIEFTDAGFEPGEGLVARGIINVDLPFLQPGTTIDFSVSGNGISLSKTFSSGEFKLPSPFQIRNSSLTISAGLRGGFEASGTVNFGIDRVGEGEISAFVRQGKFGINGTFDFDRQLFDNARVSVGYENDELTVSGTLGIPRGKVRGIKTASATVTYSGGTLSANGNAELDVRGLERGTMSLTYTEEELTIGGTFQLSNEIPRLRSGSIEVSVTKRGDTYDLSGSGTAVPDIPGLNSSISVAYQQGILTIEGTIDYERGIARGRVQVGVTNRPIDEATQQPTGEPGDSWRVYGSGDLTLRLTPWLQASAGITFTASGEMEVRGAIGIPNTLNVFDRREINRNLFRMPTLEIPLFAIPLGGRSIGLVATVGGGVDFNAGIGPGQLQELEASVAYRPGDEDNIRLGGRGKFVVPVDASLRIYGRAGVGLSIAIARISGNLELGSSVGIRGAAEAELDVSWTRVQGITLDATGRVYVEPTLKFDLGLVLEASALFFSKEWRRTLAQREFGSGLRFGLEFPIHYQQGQPFSISTDDLRVIRPDIDIGMVMRQLGRELI